MSVSRSVMFNSWQPQGLSMEFSRQEYWSGLPFPSPGDLPGSGVKSGSPALQADSLPSEPPGKSINLLALSFIDCTKVQHTIFLLTSTIIMYLIV